MKLLIGLMVTTVSVVIVNALLQPARDAADQSAALGGIGGILGHGLGAVNDAVTNVNRPPSFGYSTGGPRSYGLDHAGRVG